MDVLRAIENIRKTGTPILNQTVLLKGINDSVEALKDLCTQLISIGVFPYYLHHTDRVKGAKDFFVTLEEGRKLYLELQKQVSGIALPRYVIDPEDGSGKVDVLEYLRST